MLNNLKTIQKKTINYKKILINKIKLLLKKIKYFVESSLFIFSFNYLNDVNSIKTRVTYHSTACLVFSTLLVCSMKCYYLYNSEINNCSTALYYVITVTTKRPLQRRKLIYVMQV